MGVIDKALTPRDKLIAGLEGKTAPPKPQPAPKPAVTPKPPKAPEYEPVPVQPDEHSGYMAGELARHTKRITEGGRDIMQKRLLKTGSSKSSSKR